MTWVRDGPDRSGPAAVWLGIVLLRAAVGWNALARWLLNLELPLALAGAAVVCIGYDPLTSLSLFGAALPVGASVWLDRRVPRWDR